MKKTIKARLKMDYEGIMTYPEDRTKWGSFLSTEFDEFIETDKLVTITMEVEDSPQSSASKVKTGMRQNE